MDQPSANPPTQATAAKDVKKITIEITPGSAPVVKVDGEVVENLAEVNLGYYLDEYCSSTTTPQLWFSYTTADARDSVNPGQLRERHTYTLKPGPVKASASIEKGTASAPARSLNDLAKFYGNTFR